MRHWNQLEATKRLLLSPLERARVYRSAQAETFGGHQLADYRPAEELIASMHRVRPI